MVEWAAARKEPENQGYPLRLRMLEKDEPLRRYLVIRFAALK